MNLKVQQKIEYDPLMVTSFENKSPDGFLVSPEENQDKCDDIMSLSKLNEELNSVALEWKSIRGVKECPCSTPLDYSTPKVRIKENVYEQSK